MDLEEWKEHIAKAKYIQSIPVGRRTKEEDEWINNYYEYESRESIIDRILMDWTFEREKNLHTIKRSRW